MRKIIYYEIVKRMYDNMVTIEYEFLNKNDIYIHSIISKIKQDGRGTEALNNFLQEFINCNIYLYSTSECGIDKNILDKWYEKNGFIKCNDKSLKYNVTHCKKQS